MATKKLEAATKEAVNVRLVHRKGAFRVVLDLPAELADRIALKR